MHHLPPTGHSAREYVTETTIRDILVPIGTGEREATCFRHALAKARDDIARNRAIHSIFVVCLRANDDLVMTRVGPRGGQRCIWNFTKGKAAY